MEGPTLASSEQWQCYLCLAHGSCFFFIGVMTATFNIWLGVTMLAWSPLCSLVIARGDEQKHLLFKIEVEHRYMQLSDPIREVPLCRGQCLRQKLKLIKIQSLSMHCAQPPTGLSPRPRLGDRWGREGRKVVKARGWAGP